MPRWQQARFRVGTLWASRRLGELGTESNVDSSVQFIAPEQIRIGQGVEILRNSTLDGRSTEPSPLVIGNSARIKENVWIAAYGGHVRVGDHCLIGRNCVFQGHGGIDVGTSCGFGPGCVVLSFDVVYWDEGVPLLHQGFVKEPTRLDDDVRIGANVTILGGVHIASDVVVGAGAVVTQSLESGWVYAGNPARKLRRLEDGTPGGVISHHPAERRVPRRLRGDEPKS
jgi:maltose O-acetyltransferase